MTREELQIKAQQHKEETKEPIQDVRVPDHQGNTLSSTFDCESQVSREFRTTHDNC